MIVTKLPVISFVGTSKSGKTTFIEKLIPLFREFGLRIAVIKHHHLDFEIDTTGKDTYRHKKAGASIVILSSPRKIALVRDLERELPLQEIIGGCIDDVDLVITEGYKHEGAPKIEVFRQGKGSAPLYPHDETIVAVIADEKIDTKVAHFLMHDIEGVAKFIVELFRLRGFGSKC